MSIRQDPLRGPVYSSYANARARCHNVNNSGYSRYGARGIKICEEWLNNFEAFFEYMGPRPEGTSLDRIDNTKGYEPGNVRWATPKQQAQNRLNGKGKPCPRAEYMKNRFGSEGKHRAYVSYSSARARCYNENCPGFVNYGAKGIKMCDRWLQSFEAFFEDLGPRPEGTTLDRIDNSKGYEPDNCRWATIKEQAKNRRYTNITDDKNLRAKVAELYRAGLSMKLVAYKLGIGEGSVSNILAKINSVTDENVPQNSYSLVKNQTLVDKVAEMLNEGVSQRQIAKALGVGKSTIYRIVHSKIS